MVKRKADSQPATDSEAARTSLEVESTEVAARAIEGVATDWPIGPEFLSETTDCEEATTAGHVASEEVLDQEVFWVLLMQAGYEVW